MNLKYPINNSRFKFLRQHDIAEIPTDGDTSLVVEANIKALTYFCNQEIAWHDNDILFNKMMDDEGCFANDMYCSPSK